MITMITYDNPPEDQLGNGLGGGRASLITPGAAIRQGLGTHFRLYCQLGSCLSFKLEVCLVVRHKDSQISREKNNQENPRTLARKSPRDSLAWEDEKKKYEGRIPVVILQHLIHVDLLVFRGANPLE